MIIKSLELKNFRNYNDLNISFDAGTNILYGDNAQGKTNVLESLYLSATTKSHKGSKDREMIRFGEEEAHIRTVILKNGTEHQIDLHLKKAGSKGIAVDRVPIRRAGDLFGLINIVFFSPEDLNIIKDGPSKRRRFLDMELCQLDRIYLDDLTKYNKILRQRNQLLKDLYFRPDLSETLPVWDEQLVHYAAKIIDRRMRFVRELNEIVAGIHAKISGEKENMLLCYEPSCETGDLMRAVTEALQKDKKSGMTSVGPHRDDISFLVNGTDIRKYGSQGQQRTSALSLKLAEIELVRDIIHDKPVLLLDDVLSELDSSRQKFLLDSMDSIQTMITCTGMDEFVKNRFHINRVFYVKDGHVSETKSFEE